ncbi:MAG: SCO family protein [Acidobacteriota bacterium]|nr:SCO family protein [Acidobacteriota bacterium]
MAGTAGVGAAHRRAMALGLPAALAIAMACRSQPPPPDPAAASAAATPAPPAARSADPDSRPAPLVPGDAVPASVLAGVRHWERGGAAGNRVVVVTFTYTRCAQGNVCADVERKLRRLQDEILKMALLKGSVGLLSLSIDPSFDVPAVLRTHADRIGADAEVWRFAALSKNQVDDVLGLFGVTAPTTSTAIVDTGGRLARIDTGSEWTVADMVRDLQSLVLRADPAVLSTYVAAQEALAGDDLGGAKRALARLAKAVGEPAVSRLADRGASAPDLPAMRAAFKPLSEALVRLPWPPEYQAMYCPMFDGNRGATWVQKAGPVTNPYYGRAMLRCGTDLSAGAHADHSPKYGGVLFMAADAFHHVEGTYTPDGMFRLRVYDNFRKPMPVANFRARVVLKEEFDTARLDFRELVAFRLVPAADRMTLDAHVGQIPLPAEITLKITLDPRGSEERFDFVFAAYSPKGG